MDPPSHELVLQRPHQCHKVEIFIHRKLCRQNEFAKRNRFFSVSNRDHGEIRGDRVPRDVPEAPLEKPLHRDLRAPLKSPFRWLEALSREVKMLRFTRFRLRGCTASLCLVMLGKIDGDRMHISQRRLGAARPGTML